MISVYHVRGISRPSHIQRICHILCIRISHLGTNHLLGPKHTHICTEIHFKAYEKYATMCVNVTKIALQQNSVKQYWQTLCVLVGLFFWGGVIDVLIGIYLLELMN